MQVPEDGVIPMDTIEITRIVSLSPEMDDGDFGKKPTPEPTQMLGGGKWKRKANMPIATLGAHIAHVGDTFYVIGGQAQLFVSNNEVQVYDPVAETWTPRAKMLSPRYNHRISVVNGKIYVIGGWNERKALSSIEMYDPTLNRWERKADMPAALLAHSASVVNDRIYVIGGFKDAKTTVATVYEYTPELNMWAQKTDMPTARDSHFAGVVNGKIYVIGGSDQQLNNVKTVEVYDPATDRWTAHPDMPTPRTFLAGIVVSKSIFVIGGAMDGRPQIQRPTGLVERYDPEAQKWEGMPSLQKPRIQPAIGLRNGKIYVIGGMIENRKITSTIEELDLGALELSVSPSGKLTTTWGEVKAVQQ